MRLGVNVYLWGAAHQNRCLVECVRPLVTRLAADGACGGFWFDRFDARGPHLMFVLEVREGYESAVRAWLGRALDAHLDAHPSTTTLSAESVAALHAGCRGKVLCDVDTEPGLGANNTYRVFVHGRDAYPVALVDNGCLDGLWRSWCDASTWAVDRLADGSAERAAIDWVGGVARALPGADPFPERYWREHAARLLPWFDDHVKDRGIRRVAEDLRRSLHAAGGNALMKSLGSPQHPSPAADLVRLVCTAAEPVRGARRVLLYAITHTALKQLGLRVPHHVPLVLGAWLHSVAARDRSQVPS
jgi:hypothetical protein